MVDAENLRNIYSSMARIHEVDRAIQSGLSSGKLQFTYWPMTGQEAIPAVLAELLGPNDYLVTNYRGIHDLVAKGVPLEGLFAEALGREGGLNKGKGGSPHISDPGSGSMLTTAIVGAGAPIANGLALAAQMRGDERITIVNFGDGATSIGAVHEAMNLAVVWKLPIIFMCQNNQIAEYTPIPDYTASRDFASRAAGYGIDGVKLDGNDPVGFYRLSLEERIATRPYFTPRMCKVFKPSICAVNGICAGAGLHFVADCDIVIAGEAAQFTDTHVNVGQVTALEPIGLARRMNVGAVLRMVLLGKAERLDASQALAAGMGQRSAPARSAPGARSGDGFDHREMLPSRRVGVAARAVELVRHADRASLRIRLRNPHKASRSPGRDGGAHGLSGEAGAGLVGPSLRPAPVRHVRG